MASLINDLKIMGNEKAEFVATQNRRDNPGETPHSASIVDSKQLMDWFLSTVSGGDTGN
ncbi:MAG: hypothetical protein R3281_10830 [Balneolaceae bacterium]|nr:hypothetical protein [Balneolaceae bacterium]